MSDLEFPRDLPLSVTPAGAYYAVSDPAQDAARRLLLGILREPRTPLPSAERLCAWSGCERLEEAREVLERLYAVGWVAADATPREVPSVHFEQDLPALLARLSSRGRALLADAEGFQIALAGFSHEAGEEIAALAAELAGLHARFSGLLRGNLRLPAGGLAAVDAAGHSQLGLWPMAFGGRRFLLVVAGLPLFHQRAYADTVWGLAHRYAAT